MSDDANRVPRPRLVPGRPLPPYRYVPGQTPRPNRDPRGHGFKAMPEATAPPDPKRWRECAAYLHGIDLFNHGYYWEAHEAWEGLWNVCGRRGPAATFFKALISLAAAGLKARVGNRRGVAAHARRAADRFRTVAVAIGASDPRFMGLDPHGLELGAGDVADRASRNRDEGSADAALGFDIVLRPG